VIAGKIIVWTGQCFRRMSPGLQCTYNFGWRKVPADFADLIVSAIEITGENVRISLSECADPADERLLSETDLRNPRIQ